MKRLFIASVLVALALGGQRVSAQGYPPANYDESLIPAYELPDPLFFADGKPVKNRRQWNRKRRTEVLEVFASEMYGHVPAAPEGLHFKVLSEETVYDGLGLRRNVRIFLDAAEQHWFDVLVHLPAGARKPVPVFVGLNFWSNPGTLDKRESWRWPYEMILRSGFGVATAWRDGIEPDGKNAKILDDVPLPSDGGVRAWYNRGSDWGAISAWAWGLSRIADYLTTDRSVGALAVIGHSRLGKTALWAAANDLRFELAVSNCSGSCGAAISRRVIGESFAIIDSRFPHWFCRNFDKYKGAEDTFPADQHWLAALAAPRPLYIASATFDRWADPRGEWLCAKAVEPVYRLFGKKGLALDDMPAADTPDSAGDIAYHIRTGKHDLTAWDWEQYLDFAARHLR